MLFEPFRDIRFLVDQFAVNPLQRRFFPRLNDVHKSRRQVKLGKIGAEITHTHTDPAIPTAARISVHPHRLEFPRFSPRPVCGVLQSFSQGLPVNGTTMQKRDGGTTMDFRRLLDTERQQLRVALRANADVGQVILMDRRDTSFIGLADDVPDEEVISAIQSVPTHY
jgi:hypothetical protein